MSFKDIRIDPKVLYLTGSIAFFIVATLNILNVIFFYDTFNSITMWSPLVMSVFYYCLSGFFITMYRDISGNSGTQLNEDEIKEYFKNDVNL